MAAQAVCGFGARIAREGLPMTAAPLLKAPPAAMEALAAFGLGACAVIGLVAGRLADLASPTWPRRCGERAEH